MHTSVVIPLFNEQPNVAPLLAEFDALFARWPEFEVLLVDDGSRDGTWEAIEQALPGRSFLRGLRLPQNRGQSAAMLAGLHAAHGAVLVLLDGDLQNNPADIPAVVAALADCDVVCGYRARRQDRWSRRAASRLAYVVRNWITHDGARDSGCSLKAFRRECLGDLPPLRGVHRFMPAYFRLHGRRLREVPVDHRHRRHGQSKYTNLRRLPQTLADLAGFAWYRRRFLATAPLA